MSKIKQKLSNLISDIKIWSHSKVIVPILSPLKGSVSYLKNAPILPVIAGALIIAFIVTGLILNGSVQRFGTKFAENVSAMTHKSLEKSGFGLRDVTVEGRYNTKRAELRRVIQARIGESILKIDLDATRVRIENLPWVKSATVTRVLPDLLHIQIEERKAFALW
ncbi:MAG: FtsQ-type POTRA domain-containing protein, partial [Pseudomonadota bacterium]|nr:FtsQ-type POTRA domain-containing protein [Pseudomonadota bacterium]